MRWWARLAAAAVLWAGTAWAGVSPIAPVVPGYERFYRWVPGEGNTIESATLSEQEERTAGLLLMAELRCTACHEAPNGWAERLSSAPGPDLRGIGSRYSAEVLQSITEEPTRYFAGVRMPALFEVGSEEDAKGKVTAFLKSLHEEVPAAPSGDAERGKALYHSVGCVACHGDLDRPPGASPDEHAASNFNPVSPVVPRMTRPALVAFLQDPLRYQPDGRMPSSHLALQEAADLAAYLFPPDIEAQMPKDHAQTANAATIAEGRKIFAERGCANCHATGRPMEKAPAPALAKLAPSRGCLAAEPSKPAASFQFAGDQRRAIEAALKAIQAGPPESFTPAQAVDWQMTRLNCYACHVRGNKGGPSAQATPYFSVNDSGIESLGELGHLPPNLSHVGRKLTHGWLEKILWGEGGSVRLYMNTRMPNFGRANTEALIPLFQAADKLDNPVEIDTSGLLPHQRAEPGRALMGTTGLSCVSCHGLKDKPSLGPPVIRLTHTVERLRPEYFKELLLDPQATQPGTVMPPLFTGRKNANKEIEAIWTYLREIEGQPLPEGLLAQGDFELKPAEAGRPIVFRSFIETGGTHAIGIGFPAGLNACFDARHCRWTLLWKGRFLDAMENWQDRMMKPIRALGTDLHEPPPETAPREFRGYRLEKDGTPVMLYIEGGEEIEDKLAPDAKGEAFTRTVQRHSGGQTTSTQETWKW